MSDDELYEQVALEIAQRDLKPGAWAQAYAEADGDETTATKRGVTFFI